MARVYEEKIWHEGLGKYKTIKASSKDELAYKIALTRQQWDEQWGRKLEADRRRQLADQKRWERAQNAMATEQAIGYAMEKNQACK